MGSALVFMTMAALCLALIPTAQSIAIDERYQAGDAIELASAMLVWHKAALGVMSQRGVVAGSLGVGDLATSLPPGYANWAIHPPALVSLADGSNGAVLTYVDAGTYAGSPPVGLGQALKQVVLEGAGINSSSAATGIDLVTIVSAGRGVIVDNGQVIVLPPSVPVGAIVLRTVYSH